MKLVFGHDKLIADWVGVNLGLEFVEPYTAIGGTVDGRSIAIGAVFNNYNFANIDITLYGPGAIRRTAIRAIYHYLFKQLGVGRVTALTKRSNKLMCKKLHKLDFKYEGISERYFGPTKADDAIRFVLFPHNAQRWMKFHGQYSDPPSGA